MLVYQMIRRHIQEYRNLRMYFSKIFAKRISFLAYKITKCSNFSATHDIVRDTIADETACNGRKISYYPAYYLLNIHALQFAQEGIHPGMFFSTLIGNHYPPSPLIR
jgi:hypothetical protein